MNIEQLRQAVTDEPRNAELRYLFAAELAQQGDYATAVTEMSTALALNPLLHTARLQLGLLYLSLGQASPAATVLAPLDMLEEDNALRRFKQALDALTINDLQRSFVLLRQGVELNTMNEPLNQDMIMLATRVSAAIDEQGKSAEEVRVDFSLYSGTQH